MFADIIRSWLSGDNMSYAVWEVPGLKRLLCVSRQPLKYSLGHGHRGSVLRPHRSTS